MERDSGAAAAGWDRAESKRPLRDQLLALLQTEQNQDGAWGFHEGSQSRVEPTCWAALALLQGDPVPQTSITRAVEFLSSQQLSDGSWPANPGMTAGAWVTSLACTVLSHCGASRSMVEAGFKWLRDDYPRDSSFWQKLRRRVSSKRGLVTQSDEYRGWGWTPRTSSWVEPTSLALMALEGVNSPALASQVAQRRKLAVGLLYDRMCAGGGWNSGNPRVYGVDGDALILPTCWALLALRDAPDNANRTMSLRWLEAQWPGIRSVGSLAVATMSLKAYGLQPPPTPTLSDYTVLDFSRPGTHVAAWAAMALCSGGFPFAPVPRPAGGVSQ